MLHLIIEEHSFKKGNGKSRTVHAELFGRGCQTTTDRHLCEFLSGKPFIGDVILQVMEHFFAFCGFAILFPQGYQAGKQNSTSTACSLKNKPKITKSLSIEARHLEMSV